MGRRRGGRRPFAVARPGGRILVLHPGPVEATARRRGRRETRYRGSAQARAGNRSALRGLWHCRITGTQVVDSGVHCAGHHRPRAWRPVMSGWHGLFYRHGVERPAERPWEVAVAELRADGEGIRWIDAL